MGTEESAEEEKQPEKKEKKKKTKTVEKETKKNHKRTLKVEAYYNGKVQPHSETMMKESQEKLQYLEQKDRERIMLEESRNKVESYIYYIKNKLNDDEDEIAKITNEEQRSSILSMAMEAEDWLYEDGYDADLATFEDKFVELSEPAEAIFFRQKEMTARPEAAVEEIIMVTEEVDEEEEGEVESAETDEKDEASESNEDTAADEATEESAEEEKQPEKKEKKKKTKTVEKETKKNHKRTLKVEAYYNGKVQPHSETMMKESQEKLQYLEQKDRERIMLEESRNKVESYIYYIKNKLNDDE